MRFRMSKKYILAALVLAAAVGLGLNSLRLNENQSGMASELAQTSTAQTSVAADAPSATTTLAELTLGNSGARVTIKEYASLTCPHCAAFHKDVFKPLKAEYIDSGKVQFIMREVYFDRNGLWASMMARCAGPDRYFGLLALLFESQKEWAHLEDPLAVTDLLKKKGRLAGMNGAQIDSCMADNDMAKTMVEAYRTNSETDGVQSTPTIFVNGKKYGNMTYDELKVILETELAK